MIFQLRSYVDTFYSYLNSCSHSLEDGYMIDRNMLVTTMQYVYIYENKVHLLVF
jgi:hypothetical protein